MSITKEELQELAQREQSTFWGYLGCELIEISEEAAEIRLELKQHHQNFMGIVHGGVISSLLDNAMGLTAFVARNGTPMVTSNMNVHFVAPLTGSEAITNARIVHGSTKTVTCYAEVLNDEGKVCAIATGTFRAMRA